jgi:hypothetical protein
MKIGIATFQWADNFGAVMQAYALQSYLRNQGNEVEIINFQPQKINYSVRQFLAKTPGAILAKWEALYKRKVFQNFRKDNLQLTADIFRSGADLDRIKDKFDLLITGSDQVWNPKWLSQFEGLWDLCFLRFAGERTRLISYAASFGHADTTTIDQEYSQIIGTYLRKFDAISVREKSGIEIVSKLSGRGGAVRVIDPTLLHDKPFYDSHSGKKKSITPFLFSFMLHGLEKDSDPIERIVCKNLKLKILRCNLVHTPFRRDYVLPGPWGWLQLIRDANFVVTNSFHAVVFCLILQKPFISCLIEGGLGPMNSRIIELLEDVGLSGHATFPSAWENRPEAYIDVDWPRVMKSIGILKGEAIDYINSSLRTIE